MFTCKICLNKFKAPRFQSPRIAICGRCTKSLNSYREVAEGAYNSVREWLLNSMLRQATIDVSTPTTPLWKQERAERILGNLDAEVDRALPKWINKLVADKSNSSKVFKIIRAHRRGLLHLDRPDRWGYPNNWKEVAHNIRELDNFTCVSCSAANVELHVHHIVYASNFGTHQRSNLVTLCRDCHEKEHKRVFDFGENMLEIDEPPNAAENNSEFVEQGTARAIFHFDSGVRDFSKYAQEMVKDLGEGIKPFLLSFWEGLRHYPDMDTWGMTDEAKSSQLFVALIAHSVQSPNSTVSHPKKFQPNSMTIVVSRKEVETHNLSSVLDVLQTLTTSTETARTYFEQVDIAIHGFNETPDELFEIPAVREFIHALDQHFPYWLFFLDKSALGLQFITLCFLPPFLTEEAKKAQHTKQLEQLLLTRWFPALNEICKWSGLRETEVEKITDRSIDYLLGGPINAY